MIHITHGVPQHALQTHQAHMPSKLENGLVFPVCSKCNLKSNLGLNFAND